MAKPFIIEYVVNLYISDVDIRSLNNYSRDQTVLDAPMTTNQAVSIRMLQALYGDAFHIRFLGSDDRWHNILYCTP
jgi:hypothetical protein